MAKRRVETMEQNRAKLVAAARRAFAAKGYAAASMDELSAEAGLTRGALYHNFGDKRGLLAAVVHQIDAEMAARAQKIGARAGDDWDGLLAEGAAYIEMALDPEVQRIVLLDGPAFLGDPSQWPSQNTCLDLTRQAVSCSSIPRPAPAASSRRCSSGQPTAISRSGWRSPAGKCSGPIRSRLLDGKPSRRLCKQP